MHSQLLTLSLPPVTNLSAQYLKARKGEIYSSWVMKYNTCLLFNKFDVLIYLHYRLECVACNENLMFLLLFIYEPLILYTELVNSLKKKFKYESSKCTKENYNLCQKYLENIIHNV